jgi:hypothetical protein
MPARTERNIIVEWRDVREQFIRCVEHGESWPSQPVMDRHLRELFNNPNGRRRKRRRNRYDLYYDNDEYYYEEEWEGGTGAQTLGWLRDGYNAREFEHSAAYVPMALKDHVAWDEEEGDADVGRLVGGYDDFYLGMAPQERKPGIRVMVQMAFASGMQASTLQEYGAWVAGLLGSLEASGYDLTVDIWVQLDDLYRGDYHVRSNVLMRVKRENEVSDFTGWSVLFAPTGYRHLVFTAKCVAGDKIRKRAEEGLGTTIAGRKWGLKYDPETSVLRITCDQRGADMFGGDRFPKDRLNQQALDAKLIVQPLRSR